jgi:hypothetical protein
LSALFRELKKSSTKQEKYLDLSSAPEKSDLFSQTTIFRIFISKEKIPLLFSIQCLEFF